MHRCDTVAAQECMRMNGSFTLQYKRTRDGAREHRDLPQGRVRLVGEPRIGERLVIVSADAGGVVQTSTVQGVMSTPRGLVVQTANSLYTLVRIGHEARAA
jgi:hypothetical protein